MILPITPPCPSVLFQKLQRSVVCRPQHRALQIQVNIKHHRVATPQLHDLRPHGEEHEALLGLPHLVHLLQHREIQKLRSDHQQDALAQVLYQRDHVGRKHVRENIDIASEMRVHLGQVQVALHRDAIIQCQRQRDPVKPVLSREAVAHDHAEIGGDLHVQRGAEGEARTHERLRERLRNPGDGLRAAPEIPDEQRRGGRNHVPRGGVREVDVLETPFAQHQRAVFEKAVDFAGVVDLDFETAAHLEVELLSGLHEFALRVRAKERPHGEVRRVAVAVDGVDELVVPERDEREERLEAQLGEQLLDAMGGLLEEVLRAQIGHHHRLLHAHQRLPNAVLHAHPAQHDQPVALRRLVLRRLRVVLVDVEADLHVLGVLVQPVHLVVHAVVGERAAQTRPHRRGGERRRGELAPHEVVREVDQELVDRPALSRERAHLGQTGDQQTGLVLVEGQADGPVGRGLLVVVFDHPENHAVVELLDAALHAQLFAHQHGELVHDLHAPVGELGVGELDYDLSRERVDREVHADRRGS